MKQIFVFAMFLFAVVANAADNYIITVDGVTYPIDDPAEFEKRCRNSNGNVVYIFTSNNSSINVARKNVQSVKITIPLDRASETEFCAYLFNGCKNMTTADITFSGECTTVGDYFCKCMFYDCSSLVSLSGGFNFPKEITSVGDNFFHNTFEGCSSLVSLPDNFNIPQNITSVGYYFCENMFYNCENLQPGKKVALKFPFEAYKVFSGTSFTPETASAGSTYYIKGNSEVSAIPIITADEAELIATEYYDLDGKKFTEPQRGLNIVVESYSDGTQKSTKMLQK